MKTSVRCITALIALFASTGFGQVYHQTLTQGASDGVTFSRMLTRTTDTGAMQPETMSWQVDGTFQVNVIGDSITLIGGPNVLSINESGEQIGTFTLTDLVLTGPLEFRGGPLGSLDGTLEATTAGSLADLLGGTGNPVDVSIGFLDLIFMGVFNRFDVEGDTLTMSLWGNESLAGGGTSENWGLDWRTVGIVPEPSAVVLALAALGAGGRIVRRRFKA